MSQDSKRLTYEQLQRIATYPPHWQGTLIKAIQPGESVEEVHNELKDFEDFL